MKGIKLNLILDKTNWLEATWTENNVQIHCESFSGHREHITLLRTKAKEFNTSLKEFEPLIKQCEDAFIYQTDEETLKEELQIKLAEASQYLNSTDFYYPRFLETGESVPEEVVLKRTEAREFIRLNKATV